MVGKNRRFSFSSSGSECAPPSSPHVSQVSFPRITSQSPVPQRPTKSPVSVLSIFTAPHIHAQLLCPLSLGAW
ncbi:hypothetical protein BDP81DRAFT_219899 [Colletotrichum phormii]|uniref:Uncharacterized protein n=1 Tax=Colletotrichum phormii TaxID=359342 RepID=A0AAI9ZSA7_9PEZI|nr:uncharacterized protein BDP81DRAFT_219899 [Colletotrichum phormii]KAK1637183.1 hypothetical protein BDP81DRAFT_219899 [Colletotrichum phormii]